MKTRYLVFFINSSGIIYIAIPFKVTSSIGATNDECEKIKPVVISFLKMKEIFFSEIRVYTEEEYRQLERKYVPRVIKLG
jgi:hypothetical protein